MFRIGIGIDTGGTYTDAVAYDLDSRSVVATAKALTTRRDLAVGIMEALDRLPGDVLARPVLFALSTTLATNACVENRTGRARLVFFGGNRKNIDRFGGDFGLPPADDIILADSTANYSQSGLGDVDWDRFINGLNGSLDHLDGVGVVEMYSMRNGAVIEKHARDLIHRRSGLPVVSAHELVTDLNCLQRAASTLVNASLFPTIHAFMLAIKRSLAERGLDAPVVIVRSDGSLMSESFAELRPAETLLSGPAASVMGASALAGVTDGVVVDMGGTTSDIAVIRNGRPLRAENGIAIGRWKTGIRGLDIDTVGLGGDSAVQYGTDGMVLKEHRVVPLCIAAARYPRLKERLAAQFAVPFKHTRCLHEGFILMKDIAADSPYTDREKRLADALRDGPLLRRDAALASGRDEYSLGEERLVRDGVVAVFGLTPTDIMHIRGDFDRYDAEASRHGAAYVAENLECTVAELADMVYREVTRKLYRAVVLALLRHEQVPGLPGADDPALLAIIEKSYQARRHGGGKGLLDFSFRTDLPLIGIGAPVHVFLNDVAALLGTTAIVPEHAAVANAVGAIVGHIQAEAVVRVRPVYIGDSASRYSVYADEAVREFKTGPEAEAYARKEVACLAAERAREQGATGDLSVTTREEGHDAHTEHGTLHLETVFSAWAVGAAGFNGTAG
ncbi:MAG: hydantoinase/oxoprolinase family protein [Planctomycetaceae bacterium]|nr:hydantoinase/oxoprolinase family protein [Planctomycetaceae bacterium]